MPDSVRSLNLSTSVGIVLYEALRQTGVSIRWSTSLQKPRKKKDPTDGTTRGHAVEHHPL